MSIQKEINKLSPGDIEEVGQNTTKHRGVKGHIAIQHQGLTFDALRYLYNGSEDNPGRENLSFVRGDIKIG